MCNRFARAEEVFADQEEAIAFLDLLRGLKQGLGWGDEELTEDLF